MRWLSKLVLVLVLFWSSPSWAVQSIVQSALDAATQPWVTDGIAELTFSGDFTVGNTVCVGFGLDASSRSVSSVTDDGASSNTYALATTTEASGALEAWMYCGLVTNAANVITVTLSSACACTGVIFGWEVGDSHATTPVGNVDAHFISVATTSHPTPLVGDLALTDAGAMLLGFTYGSTGTYTLDATYVSLWNRNVGTGGSKLISAADNMVNTTSGNESSLNLLVEIRPSASAPSVNFFPRRLQVLQ